jgi:hypothetical protein
MRNKLVRTGAALAAVAVMVLGIPMTGQAAAHEHGYTYNYDYWGDVQDSADLYTVCKVYTGVDLGLETNLKNPQALYTKGDYLYLVDTGNNRIIEMLREDTETLTVTRIIDSFKGGEGPNTFNTPMDVAIDDEGYMFIADQNNSRILKLDPDLNYVMEFVKPDDSTLDADLVFYPTKVVIDTADRVYCIASGINKGLLKYEPDGVFSGFVGATPVTYEWTDYIWKRLASQEQLAQMENFVPTEYSNIYIDYEGFIYTTNSSVTQEDLRSGQADAVRKLNLMGNDILVRNGEEEPYGDLYMGTAAGHTGPSLFKDVTVFDNDIYVCLDNNRGRCFAYNDQGLLVFAFGGNGNMDGYFRSPISIEHMGHDLFVLDNLDNSITVFTTTEFGDLVFQAIEEFDQGNYTLSGESWEKVMALNGNYDLAYIGIGRSLLRQERYHEAMDYFEVKYDDENWSKAYKQYRKEWVEEHITAIVIVLVAVFLVPMIVGRVRSIKREIDKADIFRQ